MAKDEEKEVQEPLTEEQRIEQLEKKVGTSKVVLMSVALLLIIIISVSVTAFALFVAKGKNIDEQGLLDQIAQFEAQIASQQALIADQDAKILELTKKIPDIKNQLANSGNGVLLRLMDEQETSNQVFLESARTSIYDLAHMVPGSRTWLSLYSEQLDNAIEQSKQRQVTIKQLRSGATVSDKMEDDGFFGDF